jgi:predicted MPP superfamily phosphohydrolase
VGKRFWWALGIAGAASAGLFWYARRTERSRVSLERFVVPMPGAVLPDAGLTILHLSDFHFRADDPVQEARLGRLTALLDGESYDVLAFTGDLIHDMAGLPRAIEFLRTLRPTLGAFCVPGNRDYWGSAFRALLRSPEEGAGQSLLKRGRGIARRTRGMVRAFAGNERGALRLTEHAVGAVLAGLAAIGFQPLLNRAVRLSAPGFDVWLAGVDDLNNGQPDLDAALSGIPSDAAVVLLSHNPDIWLDARARRARLILAGHTHGGQIRLPLLGAWYRQGTHLPREKAAGWFSEDRTAMYVTRGLGESFPYRFCAPPQAALIRLVPDESEETA